MSFEFNNNNNIIDPGTGLRNHCQHLLLLFYHLHYNHGGANMQKLHNNHAVCSWVLLKEITPPLLHMLRPYHLRPTNTTTIIAICRAQGRRRGRNNDLTIPLPPSKAQLWNVYGNRKSLMKISHNTIQQPTTAAAERVAMEMQLHW